MSKKWFINVSEEPNMRNSTLSYWKELETILKFGVGLFFVFLAMLTEQGKTPLILINTK